jgi:hypothetical protein
MAMLQQTPLAVTAELPMDVTLPPLVAVVWVITVHVFVVTVGGVTKVKVVNVISFP